MAGNERGPYGFYFFRSTPAKQTVENFVSEGTDGSGYNNPIVEVGETLAVPEDYGGETFELSGGMFNVAGFGMDFGAHRIMEAMPDGLAPNVFAYLGKLPDISIPVGTLESIEVTAQPAKTDYYIGESFDPTGMTVTASYQGSSGSITREISGYICDVETFTESGTQTVTVSYTQGDVTRTAEVTVTVAAVELNKLEVTAPPAKTVYKVGEAFDSTGMKVTATYSDGSSREVTDYTVTPEVITTDTQEVLVSYGGKTVSVTVQLNKVTRIEVTTPPEKTAYTEGDLFNPTGMVVTAHYTDGSSAQTDSYSYEPSRRLEVGDTEMIITYSGSDGAETLQPVKIQITVAEDSGGEEYDSITVYVSYSSKGQFVTGGEGTVLCYAPVKINDKDKNGTYTMSDAFAALHEAYYSGGRSGYEDSTGGWISKFWGVVTGNVSYTRNHMWVVGTMTEIEEGDLLDIFVYNDVTYYSDLLTWFDSDSYSVDANTEYMFTVNGLNVMNSNDEVAATACPEGASVTVYDAEGVAVDGMATTTDENGQFRLTFAADGTYTIEVGGTCNYTCNGFVGPSETTSTDATVVPCRCKVIVGDGGGEKGKLGDLNGDGKVTNADVVLLLEKVTAGEDVDLSVGDINGDGKITNADVVLLLEKATAGEI